LLPQSYPEAIILQLDAREMSAVQDNLGHCETVYKAAAGSFFTALNTNHLQRRARSTPDRLNNLLAKSVQTFGARFRTAHRHRPAA
jgi:hypothetical protein